MREAIKLGNSCMQGSSAFTFGTEISEDCLYLNVYAPTATDEAPCQALLRRRVNTSAKEDCQLS